MTLFAHRFESPLGPMVMVSDGTALTGLYLEGQKHFPKNAASWSWDREVLPFADTLHQLADYFEGRRRTFDLPWSPAGTLFQKRVWKELETIPFGITVTYSELARRIGRPTATRAVGAAVGRNPLTILVPCHRVVGQNGSLTGFAGGLDRKRSLLELEATGALQGLFEQIGE